jgi:hypothetical protein
MSGDARGWDDVRCADVRHDTSRRDIYLNLDLEIPPE